jgi:hypothetical protein
MATWCGISERCGALERATGLNCLTWILCLVEAQSGLSLFATFILQDVNAMAEQIYYYFA